jgi:UDPglucose--hexose-1-phosphate uridylyltransferase
MKPLELAIPYAPRFPLEIWILPRQHACLYEEALTRDVVADLARLLSGGFRALAGAFGDPSWELALHNAPNLGSKILPDEWSTVRDDYHWYIEIVAPPERANRLGGIYINESPPEDMARDLRSAWR